MVAQIFADPGQRMANLDAEVSKQIRLADAGKLEQLRRIDRAGTDDHFALGPGLAALAGDPVGDADAAPVFEQQGFGISAGDDLQIGA